ncbi:MAG: phosphoribosyltransferase [Acidobacteriota bacterium]|nr:phosphoribosyltransferase [Acidobacteriota bacterium]
MATIPDENRLLSGRFRDRRHAGRLLAKALLHLKTEAPIVLALPRGGVPVAAEAALALEAPLDIVVVRKIGAPFQKELGVGALVLLDRPEVVWNLSLLAELGLIESRLRSDVEEQEIEARRRLALYRGDRPTPDLKGRTVVLVDDGLATGITAQAALQGLRRAQPARLVLAIPVAPPDTLARLSCEADEIVCLMQPPWFSAVGQFYDDFQQTSDEEVVALLNSASP